MVGRAEKHTNAQGLGFQCSHMAHGNPTGKDTVAIGTAAPAAAGEGKASGPC